jgi:hypothetical protein
VAADLMASEGAPRERVAAAAVTDVLLDEATGGVTARSRVPGLVVVRGLG